MSAHAAEMEIPYTVRPRPDTGLTNGKIGIWLFLASEVMLFGALFASYIMLRVGATEWPHGSHYLNIPLAALNTVNLITSSITLIDIAPVNSCVGFWRYSVGSAGVMVSFFGLQA